MTDSTSMTELLEANLYLLNQIAELLTRMDSETYVKKSPVFLNSAIGGHVRHCLEHYQSLVTGLPHGRINYDQRARDLQVEIQPTAAQARLGELRHQLAAVTSAALPEVILVLMDHGAAATDVVWQKSSTGRELQFLISHTIHHLALIAGLCRSHGITISENFGVAHSSLRYHGKQSSAAEK